MDLLTGGLGAARFVLRCDGQVLLSIESIDISALLHTGVGPGLNIVV